MMTSLLLPSPLTFAPRPILSMIGKMLRLVELESLWQQASRNGETGPALARNLLDRLQIDVTFHPDELSRIPSLGPAIVVCNHPTGFLECLILMSLLPSIRSDFKFLANRMMSTAPEMNEYSFPVDVSGSSTRANTSSMLSAVRWLRKGGLLVIFPAGAVSTWDWKAVMPLDPPWNDSAARLANLTGANSIPVHFGGTTSATFHIVGAIHPSLRLARMPAELLEKKGTRLDVRVGHSISARSLRGVEGVKIQTGFLRSKTYLLSLKSPLPANLPPVVQVVESIVSSHVLELEINLLPQSQILEAQGDFVAYIAKARQIPGVLTEIGRLREETFRKVGEGTGQSKDIDTFDATYEHIFVWNRVRREIIGSYRLAKTTSILPQDGIAGLYTNTLFRYNKKFFEQIGPAIELGRSFVRFEYQKKYAPLLVLWKGICNYVARDPRHAILFGAVSISKGYNDSTRTLIVDWLREHSAQHQLKGLVSARRPFKSSGANSTEMRRFVQSANTAEVLSEAVAEMDPNGKGLPVLLRHYLKLGGVAVAFHVDETFADVLDVLFLVDMRKADPTFLRRFMSEAGYSRFSEFHNITIAK